MFRTEDDVNLEPSAVPQSNGEMPTNETINNTTQTCTRHCRLMLIVDVYAMAARLMILELRNLSVQKFCDLSEEKPYQAFATVVGRALQTTTSSDNNLLKACAIVCAHNIFDIIDIPSGEIAHATKTTREWTPLLQEDATFTKLVLEKVVSKLHDDNLALQSTIKTTSTAMKALETEMVNVKVQKRQLQESSDNFQSLSNLLVRNWGHFSNCRHCKEIFQPYIDDSSNCLRCAKCTTKHYLS